MRRVLSLWFPRLSIDRIERRNPSLRDTPFAFVVGQANRILIHGMNACARSQGIKPGMALADARAACPALATSPADLHADKRLLRSLARWMQHVSPTIAFDAPDGLFADTTGVAHLFGGEVQLAGKVASRLEQMGMSVRVGLAGAPGAAWALARYGQGCTVVDPGADRAALAPLPVSALRVSEEVVQSSQRLGLKTIGDLNALPRASLASRFGLEALKRFDQALGREDEPLKSVRFVPRLREAMVFAEPIALTGDVEKALLTVLDKLCRRLEREEKGVRLARFTIERVDNTHQTLTVSTTQGSRAPKALFHLFRDKLDRLDAGFGIERVLVEAERTDPLTPHQARASVDAADGKGSGADSSLVDRLVNRFGYECVLRAAPGESHLPERAWIAYSAADMPSVPDWVSSYGMRPLRLLDPPRPVAVEGGQGAGVPPHKVAHGPGMLPVSPLSGPERIEPEWWHDHPAWRTGARDYWWMRGDDGSLMWLFSTGHAQQGPAAWFLHGLGG